MRSRYSAYTLHNADYLLVTWEQTKKPKAIDFSKENIDWQKLEIINTKKGGINDNKGIVTFKAFYIQHEQEHVMNEISRFVKLKGQWFYLDGTIKSIGKVNIQACEGKNAPCPCGSGKKFKRCCGA
jgi:SEC-C motif-containing protein